MSPTQNSSSVIPTIDAPEEELGCTTFTPLKIKVFLEIKESSLQLSVMGERQIVAEPKNIINAIKHPSKEETLLC